MSAESSIDVLLDTVFVSTPLAFVKQFLREQKRHTKQIRIGGTLAEVRTNLRDAVVAKRIGESDIEAWLQRVEGWGHQHLYMLTTYRPGLAHSNLLNKRSLTALLKKKGMLRLYDGGEPIVHAVDRVDVTDELARLTWRSYAIKLERREEMDWVDEREDGEFEFHAYRREPRRSASRLIIRKTDGIVLFLVDLPLGDEHRALVGRMEEITASIVAPHPLTPIYLGPVVSALDAGAVASFGPRPTRGLKLAVEPTRARYSTEGARLEFTSTRETQGYTNAEPVRRVRKAMEIENFEGEAGKFRLKFDGDAGQRHEMMVSLDAFENRLYLFSKMDETEVFALVDELIHFIPKGS